MLRLLLTCVLLALASNSLAEDWPQFRGPTGQGLSRESALPTHWGPEKNVAWKRPIPGQGWSSPVVVGGKLALTTSQIVGETDDEHLSLRALLLDAQTGETLWNVEVFQAPVEQARNVHF